MSVRGAVARCVECGQGCLPVGIMFGADALLGFERHFPPTIVFALHAREPAGKPLRGKGVAGGNDFRLARLSATKETCRPSVPSTIQRVSVSACIVTLRLA
jgi:hypothetical protein